jgi:hypothetical protein
MRLVGGGLIDALEALPTVLDATTTVEARDDVSTEVVTTRDVEGLPPGVCRVVADCGLSIAHCQPQGGHWQAVFR